MSQSPHKPAATIVPPAIAMAPAQVDPGLRRLKTPLGILSVIGLGGVGIYDRTLFTFMLMALLPSGVAWFLDRTPKLVLIRTVLPLNISTVLPYILQLYYGAGETGDGGPIPHSFWSWVAMYSSSAVGFLLYYFLPYVIAIGISLQVSKRRRELQEKQAALKEEWGTEVAG